MHWNSDFFSYVGNDLRKLLEIFLVTKERANFSKAWLKLKVRLGLPTPKNMLFKAQVVVLNLRLRVSLHEKSQRTL